MARLERGARWALCVSERRWRLMAATTVRRSVAEALDVSEQTVRRALRGAARPISSR
jgi:hypothetical protein